LVLVAKSCMTSRFRSCVMDMAISIASSSAFRS
jgi:hypothetical protein